MTTVYLWLILAVVLFVTEAAMLNFYTAWFGLGALAAALLGWFDLGFFYQVAGFLLTAILTMLAFRKPFLRITHRENITPSNVDAMAGKRGLILDPIRNGMRGRVKIDGEIWLAYSVDGDCEVGERVVIKRVEGTIVYVSKEEGE